MGVPPEQLRAALENFLEGEELLAELRRMDGDVSGCISPTSSQGDWDDPWCTCGCLLPSPLDRFSEGNSDVRDTSPAGGGDMDDATTRQQWCPFHADGRSEAGSSGQRFESWEDLEELCVTMDGCSSGRIVEIDLTGLLYDACTPEVKFDLAGPPLPTLAWPRPDVSYTQGTGLGSCWSMDC